MGLKWLSLTLFSLLMPTIALANNSNAKPSESVAIGSRPSQYVLKKRGGHQTERPEFKEAENQLIPAEQFSQSRPLTNRVLSDTAMSTAILHYLSHSSYIKIKTLSKAWNKMMCRGLANKDNPLLLPEGQELVDYTNKLLGAIPESFEKQSDELKRIANAIDARLTKLGPGEHPDDECLKEMRKQHADLELRLLANARLEVVKNLIRLHFRSDYPDGTSNIFLKAFRYYPYNVPRAERLISYKPIIGDWNIAPTELMSPFTSFSSLVDKTVELIQERKQEVGAEAEGEDTRLETLQDELRILERIRLAKLAELKPMLKQWVPYGIFLKLAFSQLPVGNVFLPPHVAVTVHCQTVNHAFHEDLKVSPPELIDIMDPKEAHKEEENKKWYAKLNPSHDQRMQSSLHWLENFKGKHYRYWDFKDRTRGLILETAQLAYQDASWLHRELNQHLTKAVRYWEYLEKLGNPIPNIYVDSTTNHATHAYVRAATCCVRIAEHATDRDTQATYYKKEAYFLGRLVEAIWPKWTGHRWDMNGVPFLLEKANGWFLGAAHAHMRAADYCTSRSEKLAYLAKALEFKLKAAVVD